MSQKEKIRRLGKLREIKRFREVEGRRIKKER